MGRSNSRDLDSPQRPGHLPESRGPGHRRTRASSAANDLCPSATQAATLAYRPRFLGRPLSSLASMEKRSHRRPAGDRRSLAPRGLPSLLAIISRPGPGRPPISEETQNLILRMATENHWRARKIQAEHEPTHQFLIFDNDAIFSAAVACSIAGFGVHPRRTAFRSPWGQNGTAERFVGTVRRGELPVTRGLKRRPPKTAAPRVHRVLQRRARPHLDQRRAGRPSLRNEAVGLASDHPVATHGRSAQPIYVARCRLIRVIEDGDVPAQARG